MPTKIDEQEIEYDERVSARVVREEMQVGPDEITVHIYQEGGADRHRKARFKVEDDREKTAYYVTTQNRAEPPQMALKALQDYGWDCINFDLKVDDELESHALNGILDGTSEALVVEAAEKWADQPLMRMAAYRAAGLCSFLLTVRAAEEWAGIPVEEVFDEDLMTAESFMEAAYNVPTSEEGQSEYEDVVGELLDRYKAQRR